MDTSGIRSTGSETAADCGNEICCCNHSACMPLRRHLLCRQWFFARWIPKRTFLPGDLPDRLRTWLRGYQYRYSATLRTARVYELLLKVDTPISYGLPWDLLLQDEDVVDYPGELSGVWALACCCDAHQINARFWAARMTESENGKFFFGDKHLPYQLPAGVEVVGIAEPYSR